MTDTLKSVVEDELQKAYERGVQEGRNAENEACAKIAAWVLKMPENDVSAIIRARGQEIELGISYEEANPPEQEPVAWMYVNEDGECEQIEYGEVFDDPYVTPLYTAPPQPQGPVIDKTMATRIATQLGWEPQREWVGLTDEEIKKLHHIIDWTNAHTYVNFARAIEAKLKEKNA